jgi:hypothetical protein
MRWRARGVKGHTDFQIILYTDYLKFVTRFLAFFFSIPQGRRVFVDLGDNTPSPAQVDMDSINTRYLLTYEEFIVPYSLRLPTYRSSYIRRYHPYPRYITSSIDDDEMVRAL